MIDPMTPDYLIIGGGIIGCSLARELGRAGQSVVVIDGRKAGSAASSRAAGMLAPVFGKPVLDALTSLCFDSAALYESWIDELDGDVGFRRAGLLELLRGEDQVEEARKQLPILSRPGRRAEILTGAEVRQREPELAGAFAGALWFPDDAQVDPDKLSTQVARAAELSGVLLHEHEAVVHLSRGGDRVAHVDTTKARYHPGTVVVTAGAWSGPLFEPLGIKLPIRPVKGQLLSAACRVAPLRTPTSLAETLFVPRSDGSLVIGVTVEEVGFDEQSTLVGIEQILARACALVPAVGKLALEKAWAGLRPATIDDWPYMGPVAPLRNLWISAGHFRKGILLAPLSARLMASSILADHLDETLEPFKPTRHSGN